MNSKRSKEGPTNCDAHPVAIAKLAARKILTTLSLPCFLLGVSFYGGCTKDEQVIENPEIPERSNSSATPSSAPAQPEIGSTATITTATLATATTADLPVAASTTTLEEIVGEGRVRGIRNPNLARTAASNRARSDLLEKLKTAGRLGPEDGLPPGVNVEVQFDRSTKTAQARASLPSQP